MPPARNKTPRPTPLKKQVVRDTSLKGRLRALMTWRVMKRVLKWSSIISLALTALMAAVIAITFWIYARDPKLPSVEKLKNYDPQQVTRIVVAGSAR